MAVGIVRVVVVKEVARPSHATYMAGYVGTTGRWSLTAARLDSARIALASVRNTEAKAFASLPDKEGSVRLAASGVLVLFGTEVARTAMVDLVKTVGIARGVARSS